MIAVLAALLTAIGFYFATGLGEQWWLLWLAPVPVLWLAFDETRPGSQVAAAAFFASALGAASILRAYGGVMPLAVMMLALCGPALLFMASVQGARRIHQAFGAIPAMFGFAVLWTACDFLTSFSRAGGAGPSPANAEVGAPMLIQSAALVGFLGVTFLVALFAAGIALTLRTRQPAPALLAVVAFAANAGYGAWRISQPADGTLHVALIDSNDVTGKIHGDDEAAAMKAIDAYVAEIESLRGAHVALVVLPENTARLAPAWRDTAQAKLAKAANDLHATLVAGFNTTLDGAQRNVSFAFAGNERKTYIKRRLVLGLETQYYTPGTQAMALADGTGLEICKDMDFQAMVRDDEAALHPRLLAVPAWDFDADDWSHARVAVMRSVENGVPMARSAREGLLTLNDRYGRLVAKARTTGAFKILVGDLPLSGEGGHTLYDRIGDSFGWLCLAASVLLVGAAVFRRKHP